MDEFYFSVSLGDNRTLCLAPITDRWIAMSGENVADPSGYFLFEKHGSDEFGGIEIIARVVSEDAVFRLREMFKMT